SPSAGSAGNCWRRPPPPVSPARCSASGAPAPVRPALTYPDRSGHHPSPEPLRHSFQHRTVEPLGILKFLAGGEILLKQPFQLTHYFGVLQFLVGVEIPAVTPAIEIGGAEADPVVAQMDF